MLKIGDNPPTITTVAKPITTFVQAESESFRDVVQRLTGPSEGTGSAAGNKKQTFVKRPVTKLHERRKNSRLEILKPQSLPPKHQQQQHKQCVRDAKLFSPSKLGGSGFFLLSLVGTPTDFSNLSSPLGTPSAYFSKLSIEETQVQMMKMSAISDMINIQEEERAIKERRFYLHPSPCCWPDHKQPELLPLFPLSSSKASATS